MQCLSWSLTIFFILKFILFEIRIATLSFFWFPFTWNIFLHPFTFSPYVSLSLKWVSCRQHIYGSCFCIHSVSLYLLLGAFTPFTFKVIFDTYVPSGIFMIDWGLFLWVLPFSCVYWLYKSLQYCRKAGLLLLSHFSRVRLCVTPQTAAHQAPPSLGFSRQEHWSGSPLPSPMHESEN